MQLNDRVRRKGYAWKEEPDRVGTVVRCYRGAPTSTAPGVAMVSVLWDDTGRTEDGYLAESGGLIRLQIVEADARAETKRDG
jgi:hypothetical protein